MKISVSVSGDKTENVKSVKIMVPFEDTEIEIIFPITQTLLDSKGRTEAVRKVWDQVVKKVQEVSTSSLG